MRFVYAVIIASLLMLSGCGGGGGGDTTELVTPDSNENVTDSTGVEYTVYSKTAEVNGESVNLHAVVPENSDDAEISFNLITEIEYRLLVANNSSKDKDSFSQNEELIRSYFNLFFYDYIAAIPNEEINAVVFGFPNLMKTLGIGYEDLIKRIILEMENQDEKSMVYRSTLAQVYDLSDVADSIVAGDSISIGLLVKGTLNKSYDIKWIENPSYDISNIGSSEIGLSFNNDGVFAVSVAFLNKDGDEVYRTGKDITVAKAVLLENTVFESDSGYQNLGGGLAVAAEVAADLASDNTRIVESDNPERFLEVTLPDNFSGTSVKYKYNPLIIKDPATLSVSYEVGVSVYLLDTVAVDYENNVIEFKIPDTVQPKISGKASDKVKLLVGQILRKPNSNDVYELLQNRRDLFKVILNVFRNESDINKILDYMYSDDGKAQLFAYLQKQDSSGAYNYDKFASLVNIVVAEKLLKEISVETDDEWKGKNLWIKAFYAYYNYHYGDNLSADMRIMRKNLYEKPTMMMNQGLSAWLGAPVLTSGQTASMKGFSVVYDLVNSGRACLTSYIECPLLLFGMIVDTKLPFDIAAGTIQKAVTDEEVQRRIKDLYDITNTKNAAAIGKAFLPNIASSTAKAVLMDMIKDELINSNLSANAPYMLSVANSYPYLNTKYFPSGFTKADFVKYFFGYEDYNDDGLNDNMFRNLFLNEWSNMSSNSFASSADPTGRLSKLFLQGHGLPDNARAEAYTWMKAAFGSSDELSKFRLVSDNARLSIIKMLFESFKQNQIYTALQEPDELTGIGSYNPNKQIIIKSQYKVEKSFAQKLKESFFGKSKVGYMRAKTINYDIAYSVSQFIKDSAQEVEFAVQSINDMVFGKSARSSSSEIISNYTTFSTSSILFNSLGVHLNTDLFESYKSGNLKFNNINITIAAYDLESDVDKTFKLGDAALSTYDTGTLNMSQFTVADGKAYVKFASVFPKLASSEYNNKMLAVKFTMNVVYNGKINILEKEYYYATIDENNPNVKQTAVGNVEIKGRLTDNSSKPLSSVTVVLMPTGLMSQTDEDGNYVFSNVTPGKYRVEVLYETGNYINTVEDIGSDDVIISDDEDVEVPEGLFKLKKTGQTTSYINNDDGFYQKGVEASYTRDNVNGIVTDNVTGLMWQDDTVGQPVSRQSAVDYCDALTVGSYSDWRLPTIWELLTIVDYSEHDTAIHKTFLNSLSAFYFANATSGVDFSTGKTLALNESPNLGLAKCVRTSLPVAMYSNFSVPDKKVIADTVNHLLWQDDSDVGVLKMNWQSAINYCEKMTLAGYDDWRVPNIRELTSQWYLLYNNFVPHEVVPLEKIIFSFWASTTYSGDEVMAWVGRSGNTGIFFVNNGIDFVNKTSANINVRCVRTIKSTESWVAPEVYPDQELPPFEKIKHVSRAARKR